MTICLYEYSYSFASRWYEHDAFETDFATLVLLYGRGAPAFPTLAIETIGLGLGLGIAGVGITGVGIAVCTLVVLGSGTDIWALLKYLFVEYLIQDFATHVNTMPIKGTRRNVERGGSFGGGAPLVSFNHVIDPHFVTFSSSLYTTIRNPNPDPNPNRNPTVITDPHIGHLDPQIVTVQIHHADPFRSTFCRVPT